jgi:hypothetical protein
MAPRAAGADGPAARRRRHGIFVEEGFDHGTEAEKGDVHGRVDHKSLARILRSGARCLLMLGLIGQSKAWDERAAGLE